MLLHGLRLTLTHPGPLVWTYVFNLGIALLFSWRLHAQLGSILDRSLEGQRLTSAFDLGTVLEAVQRLGEHAPGAGYSRYAGLPLYLMLYLILVPGALFSYQSRAPARLSILLSSGLSFFWRFVRIMLLTLFAGVMVMLPLAALNDRWAEYVDDRWVGMPAFGFKLLGITVLVVAACVLRLYFDLVEVYTVMLGDQFRPSGKADRRVHRVLLPAFKTLCANFPRAFFSFFALTAVGLLAVLGTSYLGAQTLAQPRVWPMFLLAQAGLFLMLLTRFWQRGAETTLACDNRLPPPTLSAGMAEFLLNETIRPVPIPYRRRAADHQADALPDPEPAAPSLEQPDPEVFHHEPGAETRREANASTEDTQRNTEGADA